MLKCKVKVTYRTTVPELCPEVDEKIRIAMGRAGFEWTGQGYDLETNVRDIGFEYTLQ